MSCIPFQTYCDKVCCMVRWKPYRAAVAAELTAHLEDHAEYHAARGVPPEVAVRGAVEAMGDPYALGKSLDALHSPWYPRLSRVFAVLALSVILVTTLSGFLRGSTLFERRFTPFADPAELVLLGNEYTPLRTLLAAGDAEGGGSIGVYNFSSAGAAALLQESRDYGGDIVTTYQMDLVFSSTAPLFWLRGYRSSQYDFILSGPEGTQEVDASLYELPQQGIFRRFYCFSVYLDGPVYGDFTVTLDGGARYSFTLKEGTQ